jgi:hypothetical protein
MFYVLYFYSVTGLITLKYVINTINTIIIIIIIKTHAHHGNKYNNILPINLKMDMKISKISFILYIILLSFIIFYYVFR